MAVTHREAVDRYVADMRVRGVRPWNSAPPLFRLFWACGSRVPPPHLLPFSSCARILGGYFCVLSGPVLFFTLPRDDLAARLVGAAGGSIVGGLVFGRLMAWTLERKRAKLVLPPWDSYIAGDAALPEPTGVPHGR